MPRPAPGWPSCRRCTWSGPSAAENSRSCSSPTSRRPGAGSVTCTPSRRSRPPGWRPGPGPRVRAAYESIMDARHALHEITGRPTDRLVLQEQDEVARVLGLLDADALMRHLAGAGRTVAYSVDQAFRQAQRSRGGRRRGKAQRRPLADGLVEQDGEVVLARAADPATDPALPLRAAAAAAAGRAGAGAAHAGPAGRLPAAAGALAAGRPGRPGHAARRRAGRHPGLGGAGPGGPGGQPAAGLGPGAEPAAAQPAAHLHRGPAPGRDGRPGRRADPRRGPP